MSSTNAAKNSSYANPILPGWHSDPSCTFVAEEDNTFFCTTSSFLTFPGIPIYASKDLLNWKLVSHVVTRPTQVPEIGNSTSQTQQDGLWASTIRYRKGKFYLLTSYVSMYPDFGFQGLLFTTENIYSDKAWSEPLRFEIGDIDPDIFWENEIAYISYAGVSQTTLDLETGATGPSNRIWNGTGAGLPEGPHIYKRDGWYYLCIGEGGTELGHQQVIARSKNVTGPFEGYGGNPILTNTNTTEYFQTVGHADLFQDGNGNWWGVALATRSGPAWRIYPMGRETVLFPVTWKEGEWPILEPVQGRMTGWELPVLSNSEIPGDGQYVDAPDRVDFPPGSPIPQHFLFWRFPEDGAFTVSPRERPFTLRLLPSRHNITGIDERSTENSSITLITRRQSHTYFTYSVDVSFNPKEEGEEVGVTVFLTQYQHIDLGIVLLSSSGKLIPHVRFQTTLLDDLNTLATQNVTVPETVVKALPSSKKEIRARLQIRAVNDTHYTLSAAVPGLDDFDFNQHAETLLSVLATSIFQVRNELLVRAAMYNENDLHPPPCHPPEEKSDYQTPKEGGYDSMQHFMHTHLLKMHNDDDVQEAKAILECSAEHDRIYANENAQENNRAYDSSSDSDISSCGVRICGGEVVQGNGEADTVEGAYSYFEWGVDEPEFEGYALFSDDEDGYLSGKYWNYEAVCEYYRDDDGDNEDFGEYNTRDCDEGDEGDNYGDNGDDEDHDDE
ncbi:glycosyl hydrolase [Aspergillus spectabilis]